MNVDVLAIAAHPDDVELCCGGTMLKMAKLGYKTAILDLTAGEMGTRGTPQIRAKEAAQAAKILRPRLESPLGRPRPRCPPQPPTQASPGPRHPRPPSQNSHPPLLGGPPPRSLQRIHARLRRLLPGRAETASHRRRTPPPLQNPLRHRLRRHPPNLRGGHHRRIRTTPPRHPGLRLPIPPQQERIRPPIQK